MKSVARKIYPPLDREGRKLRVGDRVRVVGVPNLEGMSAVSRRETTSVFQHILGTYRRIAGFDPFGYAGIEFVIRKGPHWGSHLVMIEPTLLSLRVDKGRSFMTSNQLSHPTSASGTSRAEHATRPRGRG
jgi:hypothetical protein